MEQSFPDGVSVRIESVQIGGAFSHTAESPVENSVHSDGTGCCFRSFDNFAFDPNPDDRSLYVWFRTDKGQWEHWSAMLTDKDGLIEGKYSFDTIKGRVSQTAAIVGFRFPSFPRDQKTLRITLVRGGEWNKQKREPGGLDFSIPNPSADSAGDHASAPHALAQEIDGTQITLSGLDTGITMTNPDGTNRTTSRVRFTADDAGKPSRLWGLRMLNLTDSLGNSLDEYRASNITRFNDDGLLELWLYSTLWLSGNPWALDAEFVRVDELPVSQRTTVKNLPVTPAERMVGREKKQQFEIRAEEFPDSPVMASYYTACDQPGNILRLALELDKVPEGFHCGILEVKDDAGKATHRVFGFNDFKVDNSAKRENPRYLIDIPDTSKTVEITFGIQKIRRLTFRSNAVLSNDPFPVRR
jgi:hypothetical protein